MAPSSKRKSKSKCPHGHTKNLGEYPQCYDCDQEQDCVKSPNWACPHKFTSDWLNRPECNRCDFDSLCEHQAPLCPHDYKWGKSLDKKEECEGCGKRDGCRQANEDHKEKERIEGKALTNLTFVKGHTKMIQLDMPPLAIWIFGKIECTGKRGNWETREALADYFRKSLIAVDKSIAYLKKEKLIKAIKHGVTAKDRRSRTYKATRNWEQRIDRMWWHRVGKKIQNKL